MTAQHTVHGYDMAGVVCVVCVVAVVRTLQLPHSTPTHVSRLSPDLAT